MKTKRVSLVLTTYNCRDNFIRTMESIAMQNYGDIEVVIKDGGSGDGTIEQIQRYKDEFCYPITWVSKPDNGLYDAMNQGVEMCRGDYVQIFNERFLKPDAVSRMVKAIERETSGCIGAHCDLDYMDGERVIRKWRMGQGRIRQGWLPGHPTLMLKREVYEKYGYYDTDYKISADYEFMIRFLKDENNYLAYVPDVLVGMYYGGTSTSSLKSYVNSVLEGHKALEKNHVKGAYLIDIRRTIRVLGQFGMKRI